MVSVSVRLNVAVRLRICVTGGGIEVVVNVMADAMEVMIRVVVDISMAGHVKELLAFDPATTTELRVVGLSVHMP